MSKIIYTSDQEESRENIIRPTDKKSKNENM